jgi:hypothetical protein
MSYRCEKATRYSGSLARDARVRRVAWFGRFIHKQKAVSQGRLTYFCVHTRNRPRSCRKWEVGAHRCKGSNLYLRPHPLEANKPTTTNSLHAIFNLAHLQHCTGAMHDVKSYGLYWALASRIEKIIQIPRDKKPRGGADRFSLRWAQHGGKQGNMSQRGCHPCGNSQIGNSIPSPVIVFTPRNGVGFENRAGPRGESSISHLSRWPN